MRTAFVVLAALAVLIVLAACGKDDPLGPSGSDLPSGPSLLLIPSVPPLPSGIIGGRWPRLSDGSPVSRRAPITRISHQVNDERPGWQWTKVECTTSYHWQRDVKVQNDALSVKLHGNSDNHRIQIGEPAVFRTISGYRLEFYAKHDRAGDNPIVKFTVYLAAGRVTKVVSNDVRGAPALQDWSLDLTRRGVNVGVQAILDWSTGGIIKLGAFGGIWGILDWLFPEDWLHQYKGWEQDATWFATQVGYLYARAIWG